MSAFYPQMIAEELRVHPDCITLVMGDTDKTPDGGYSAGFLNGAANVRKVAAYTYQALLGLAATRSVFPLLLLRSTMGWCQVAERASATGSCSGSPTRSKDSGHRHAVKFAPPEAIVWPGWIGRAWTAEGRGRSAHETGERVQNHRHVLSHARYSRQSHRPDAMELRRDAARDAACSHGAAAYAGLSLISVGRS